MSVQSKSRVNVCRKHKPIQKYVTCWCFYISPVHGPQNKKQAILLFTLSKAIINRLQADSLLNFIHKREQAFTVFILSGLLKVNVVVAGVVF